MNKETGVCLPDASNMPELCEILGITINDLFSGEVVDMKDNEKRLEENLLEMTRTKEERDKELLSMEIFIGVLVTIVMLTCTFVSILIDIKIWLRTIIAGVGIIQFIIGICYALKIEQLAGYYECDNCHYKYVPTYRRVFFARHFNRTRKMQCPKCRHKTWHKKVITK